MPYLVCVLLQLYLVAIFVRIVLTWFPTSHGSPVAVAAGFLATITDPVLGPVRRLVPPIRIGATYIEISSIIVIFGGFILLGLIGCG